MTTYFFPGQGSQIKGMGTDLFEQFPQLTAQADALMGYSIQELCLLDPHERLSQTEVTQPALFVVNALTYLKKIQQTSQKPHYLAGHSLGEYNALFAAEVFDFATGVKLVKKRGQLMSQATQGKMAAVIGLAPQEIEKIFFNHSLHKVGIANYNSKNQLVISGDTTEIMTALPLLTAAGAVMAKLLNVSGAFHSPLMYAAQIEFAEFLKPFHFAPPKIPVLANISARPYPNTSEKIKDLLTQQISHPVRFEESVNYLLAEGEQDFEEIGPGNVLTKTIRRIQNGQ